METKTQSDSPATLVAIIVAARQAGFRDLEREMKQRLEENHGVRLTFARPPEGQAAHA